MPYKRKRSFRKRKRTFKKRLWGRKYKMYKRLNSNLMHVMLRTPDTVVSNSNLQAVTESYRFSLSACLNNSNYATMWDQYRINKVVITWKPIRTQDVVQQVDDTTPSSTTNIPKYVVAKDFDDLSPVSYNDTRARFGSVERLATTPGKMIIKPATLTEIYQSTVSTAYSPNFGKWLDTAYASVPHYGVRLAMETAEPTGYYALECSTKIYLSFKNRVV